MVFVLHETYVNPIRIVEQPPFEVTECGWGQFEVKIEIYFHSIPGLNPLSASSSLSLSKRQKTSNNNHNKLIYNNHNGHSHNKNNKNHRKRKRKFNEMVDDDDDFKMYDNLNNNNNNNNNQQIWSLNDKQLDKLCAIKQQQIVEMYNNEVPKEMDDDNDSDSSSDSDNNDKCNKVVFLHSLRLFEKPGSGEDHKVKGIVEEKYATIEFNEPYYYLYEQLILGPQKMGRFDHPFWTKYWKFNVIKFAEMEQELISKITKCHQSLIKNLDEKRKEYEQLLAKCNENGTKSIKIKDEKETNHNK